MTQPDVYILSLQLDAASFEWLQALRELHFPPSLNKVPAHLTLFHSISLDQILRLKASWELFERFSPVEVRFIGVRSLGRGTAVEADAPGLEKIRERMIETMSGSLSRQDQQKFKAHVTIQNKVDPAAAKSLLQLLSSNFVVRHGLGEGVIAWKYLRGPWLQTDIFPFVGATSSAE